MKCDSDLSAVSGCRDVMVTRRVFLTLLWAVAGSIAPTGAPDAAHGETADRSLLILLPSPEDVRPWVPDASAQFAEGQELFALINGGAEIFLRHGFERATTQTYSLAEGRHIQVEIYRMGTEDGATAVYLRKIGSTELRLAIGDAGVRGEYYIVFRTGRFLVTVTASDPQEDAQASVLRIARAIERRIPATCP